MIVTLVRPRSFLSPLLFSLSLHLHRGYGSRNLIDVLWSFGLAASYSEVQRFITAVCQSKQEETPSSQFIQFIFDNADFNANTLDGLNTFHSMGGIVASTPPSTAPEIPIPRSSISNNTEIDDRCSIPIVTYSGKMSGLKRVIAISLKDIQNLLGETEFKYGRLYDTLWYLKKSFQSLESCSSGDIPNWNGFMSITIGNSKPYTTSSIKCLPFINLDPSNPTAIYSVLNFAKRESKRHKMGSTIITFDQPLYIKACDIKFSSEELEDIILRLGGFHTLMSFLGSIGEIMAGSGLEEAIGVIYAENSVPSIMNGHAYSRAVRAHLLVSLSLMKIIIGKMEPLPNDFIHQLETLIAIHDENSVGGSDLVSTNLKTASSSVEILMNSMKTNDRTSKLWCQYLELVQIVQMFIRAERTGNWSLHLYCIKKMIPFFHAAGHLNYAKAAHLYLQEMLVLHEKMPSNVFQKFTKEGYFTIRRTNKYWSGVWSDLTIEQVLMRSMKSSGGLTRGRGITENTLIKWISGIPATLPYSLALEEICGVRSESSEQHKELRSSRIIRDNVDEKKIGAWFELHNPFTFQDSERLFSITSGVVGDDEINCDRAEQIGLNSVESVEGKSFGDVKLKRSAKVKSLASVSNSLTIKGVQVTVNQSQLFNRILCVAKSEEEVRECFTYELCSYPSALFDHIGLRNCKKSALLQILPQPSEPSAADLSGSRFVIDGGYLLHKVVWTRDTTYENIFRAYLNFVKTTFNGPATVVFDGYPASATTKSQEQERRRMKRRLCKDINFLDHMKASATQEDFLSNRHNKCLLIKRLSHFLITNGVDAESAGSDADVMIVTTALRQSKSCKVIIVGEDTDLIVLFAALGDVDENISFYTPGNMKKPPKFYQRSRIIGELGVMRNYLLPLHAISGCDTTSALFRQGKNKPFLLAKRSEETRQFLEPFMNADSSKEEIAKAGENF